MAKPTMNLALSTNGVPAGREGGGTARGGPWVGRVECSGLHASETAPRRPRPAHSTSAPVGQRLGSLSAPPERHPPEASLQGRLSLAPLLASAIPGVTSAQNWVLGSSQNASHPARLAADSGWTWVASDSLLHNTLGWGAGLGAVHAPWAEGRTAAANTCITLHPRFPSKPPATHQS